ncbi:MAG: chemotaxis protein CheA [Alicyclobacillus herbarius]|uniref:chemotaxis protein CheA n=1 Tax=Alicyclobacillus herbarius TaxID=122960 RepID=UPI00235663F0|nr:chemotaxis protein CheA [Alicyclobacillus herbarius]MCL6632837.1 chemotaxis protein CheA [Alicyclobacillus herbarius]
MDTSQYIQLFLEEAQEHLQSLADSLLELERDEQNTDIIQRMFRSAHTLKGMAASMGFEQMAHLTHEMEDGLDGVRSGRVAISGALIDALFACVDALEACVQAVMDEGTDTQVEIAGVSEQLAAALSAATSIESGEIASTKSAEQAAKSGLLVRVEFTKDCTMPAVRAFMVHQALEGTVVITYTDPPMDRVMAGECGGVFTLGVESGDEDAIRAALAGVAEIEQVTLIQHGQPEIREAPTAGPAPETQSRDPSRSLPQADRPTEPKRPAQGTSSGSQSGLAGTRAGRGQGSIRVDLARLDDVMNRFSEIVMDKTRLRQLAAQRRDAELSEAVHHFERVCDDLQALLLRIRMLPVETVFQRFPRMVRDLAKSLGKRVDLHLEGQETELDRTIMDEVGDSLVHLIRNAMDHGLETPEERLQAGKPEVGTLRLSAYQRGDDVFIEVADDGRGLDRVKIANKAVERGLIDPDQVAELSDEAVYGFLFESGFSTAERVSDISGRGVGLDAVRDTIAGLGGEVQVRSTPGKGTTFILRMPLTLSIIQAMLIRVGDERYAVPISSLLQIYQVDAEQIRETGGRHFIQLDGRLLRLLDTRNWMGTPSVPASTEPLNVAVLGWADRSVAVIVDEFLDTEEIVVKPLGGYLQGRVPGISGAAILGDGAVVLILNAADWIAKYGSGQSRTIDKG